MNKTQRRWIKALRSGDYIQARRKMRFTFGSAEHPYAYCCLGVACDLAIKNDEVPGLSFAPTGNVHMRRERQGVSVYSTLLPAPIARKMGLTDEDMGDLANLNDNGFSFEWIADVLEHVFEDGSITVHDAHNELAYYAWRAVA